VDDSPVNDSSRSDILLCQISERVAHVTLNRPERMNALSRELRRRIAETMSELGEDPAVGVVVISGAGGRAFSAGADVKDIDAVAREARTLQTPMTGADRNVFESVLELPKPTIAAIDGYAIAGGLELALACDLRIASDTSVFGIPEAQIGMGANFASVVLPRIVPRAIAFELLYTGEQFSSQRALEWGLLNKVVSKTEFAEEVDKLARSIARNAPLSLGRYKEMMLKGWEMPVPAALRLNVGPNPYTSADRAEGIRALLEKREPKWTGQ